MSPRVRTALSWLATVLLTVVLPVATYLVLTGLGVSPVVALLVGAVWALARAVISGVRQRHVDELSVLALVTVGVAIVSTLAFHDARILVLRSVATTGLLGLVMLVSLLFARPVMFYLGRRFATDGTAEGAARWDSYERYPAFRRANRVITAVWGGVLLGEAVLRVLLALWAPLVVSVAVGHVVPTLVVVGLVAVTTWYGRRVRRAAVPAGVADPLGAGS